MKKTTEPITDVLKLELYLVRNSQGQWFRAKGFGGGGESWVVDLSKAKVYGKLAQARRTVSYFANSPNYPAPKIVKLVISGYETLDESERVEKSLAKRRKARETAEVRQRKYEFKLAEDRLAQAQKRYEQLKATQ